MSAEQSDGDDAHQQARDRYEKTRSTVQTVGAVILIGTLVAVAVPMIISTAQGVASDRVWDPFTGEPVAADEVDVDCVDEAVVLARHDGELDGDWERRFRRWRQRCSDDNVEMYRMLDRVRDDLRAGDQIEVQPLDD